MATPIPEVQPVARAATADAPLLQTEGLEIHFNSPRGVARVVDGTNLTIYPDEIVGIAGESGCSKTALVEAILQTIRFPNRVARGKVMFTPRAGKPVDLMTLSTNQMHRYRTEHIAYVPQGSWNSRNPVMRIEDQIVDGLVVHGLGQREAKGRVLALREKVWLEPRVGRLYPHELSGGERQRVMLARAYLLEPRVIVADEAISMLDVAVRAVIMNIIVDFKERLGISTVFITHDLSAAYYLGADIMVMHRGRVVETSDSVTVMQEPKHPYTQ